MSKYIAYIFALLFVFSGVAHAQDDETHWLYDGNDIDGYTPDTGFGYVADKIPEAERMGLPIDFGASTTIGVDDFIGDKSFFFDDIDDGYYQIPIPNGFSFPFYGEVYNTGTFINISTNGLITLGDDLTDINNKNGVDIPNGSAPHTAIYAYWLDMAIDDGGSVEYGISTQGKNKAMVIKYNLSGPCGGVYIYEVALYSNGDIRWYVEKCENVCVTGDARLGIEGREAEETVTSGIQMAKFEHHFVGESASNRGYYITYPSKGHFNFSVQPGHDAGSGCLLKTLSTALK